MLVVKFRALIMNGKIFLVAIVLLGLFLIAGCNSHTERPLQPEELYRRGQTLYLENCAECHQADGMGWSTLYPRLAGNPVVTLEDPEPIMVIVLYGQGLMPGFHQRLTSDEVAAILTYIRNSWGNHAPAVSARQVY